MPKDFPLIIGHRGACGYLPEHTLASYQLAIDFGADMIEADLVPTRDGALLCRHESELSLTTDVAGRQEFYSWRKMKTIDGVRIEGWFSEDFALEEIQTLRARQRLDFRDLSHDHRYPVPTLQDLLALAADSAHRGKPVGVMLEIKHATYFASVGLAFEELLPPILREFSKAGPTFPIWIESFEPGILRRLREQMDFRLVQLIDKPSMRPADFTASGDPRTFADLLTPDGLADIATYAVGIGVWKRLIVPALMEGMDGASPGTTCLGPPTSLVADAHAAGLLVHAWTFRNESRFLAADYAGDPRREYEQFESLGVDGFITDFPARF
ncbi:MAG: glycerophosphoryl diester phosphodiesterase [Phycisphaerales bacterium]|nr:glycerophosphoryl diester phosphodiesterase [Phycisphaerales bacterium]